MKTFLAVIGLLFVARKLHTAKTVNQAVGELVPLDPYGCITFQSDVLNGSNINQGGGGPVAQAPYFALLTPHLRTENPLVLSSVAVA